MQVLVKHPYRGKVVVEALSRTSAFAQAAIFWGCGFTEVAELAKCFIRKEDAKENDGAGRAG